MLVEKYRKIKIFDVISTDFRRRRDAPCNFIGCGGWTQAGPRPDLGQTRAGPGLDPGQTEHMRALIERLAESATVILSTHIMQEVDAICDRAIILRAGALVLDERLADLKESNRYRLRSDPTFDAGRLEQLPQVSSVEIAEPGTFAVSVNGDLDEAGRALAEAVVGANQPLYELMLERRDLETVFREVNAATEVPNAA